jgi:hypothetical protein
MNRFLARSLGAVLVAASASTLRLAAQTSMTHPSADTACPPANVNHATMDHAAHPTQMANCGALPTQAPQAAYATLGEVVRLLKADSTTDWSKVNLEALRQHLIDMDDVVLRAEVSQHNVPAGLAMNVTGTGRTAAAIKRMVQSHAIMLGEDSTYAATAQLLPTGVLLTVTARNPANTRLVAMIRGMGFAGLLTEGDHHAKHHMALARGVAATMSP